MRLVAFVFLLGLLSACQRVADEPAVAPSEAEGRVLQFAFGTTDGQEVTSENTRGRVTVLVFVTTFDMASQLVARRLEQVFRTHHPQIHAAAVVLEAPKYAPLADVFKSALELSYPVALADSPALPDAPALASNSNIGEVRMVPTVLVLDGGGREIVRKPGLCTVRELESWVAQAQRP
ncbi:MAG TPA: TlpA family protein disulfide reductase [Polyangiaceae bacterium]